MKVLKCLVIVSILIVFTSACIYATEIEFADINKHWAKNTIQKFLTNNVVSGYEDNTFKPDNNITIAEFLKMVVCAGKYDLVRKGNAIWPDFYISTAKENELLLGEEISDFNQNITRNQACKIISNFINVSEVSAAKNKFKDVSGDYEDEVLKLVKLEVISGYKDKTFKGENYLTRAEAITILDRALTKKEELIKNKKYRTDDSKYSNYQTETITSNGAYSKTRYAIIDEGVYIYDEGKYANLDGYKFSGEIIETSKIIKVITSLINENAYVAVLYQPSQYTINQLQILYGNSKEKLACGEIDLSITFFENKYYELARISMENKFSNKVFAKLEVVKLWEDYSEFELGNTVDNFKKLKLKGILNVVCKPEGEKICTYIVQKYKKYAKGKLQGKEIKEHKVFGKYIVDCYKKENGVLTFYFSER